MMTIISVVLSSLVVATFPLLLWLTHKEREKRRQLLKQINELLEDRAAILKSLEERGR